MRMRDFMLAAGVVLLAAACSRTMEEPQGYEPRQADAGAVSARDTRALIAGWPAVSRTAANEMLAKYGEPDGSSDRMLIWHDAAPWRFIMVSRDPIEHRFPKAHEDVVEQAISYRVPTDKFDELAEYDGSVIVERTKGVMSARCDKEPMNFLALNLAHDIVTGSKSVQEARDYYARAATDFMAGRKDPYTEGLKFSAQGATGDADRPAGQ